MAGSAIAEPPIAATPAVDASVQDAAVRSCGQFLLKKMRANAGRSVHGRIMAGLDADVSC
jgi:hypothetical protein